MSEEIENPQAFPIGKTLYYEKGVACTHEGHDGMDLRDYFAAKALQAIMPIIDAEARKQKIVVEEITVCKDAYRYADAMLRARQL